MGQGLMRIIVFGTQPHSPHFETQLEIMQQHIDAGDDVSYVSCDRALPYCDANRKCSTLFCLSCVGKRENGLKLLPRGLKQIRLSDYIQPTVLDDAAIQAAIDTNAFNTYKVDDYDCGEAVLSSFYSDIGHICVELGDHLPFLKNALTASITIHTAAVELLSNKHYDLAYLFNGRDATGRAWLRACEKTNTPFFVHERGSSIDSYMLIPNTVPHDVHYRNTEIKTYCDERKDQDQLSVADKFYSRMSKGKMAHRETNHLKLQNKDLLPDGWNDTNKKKVVFFTSTETERSALTGFYQKRFYADIPDAINRITSDLNKQGFDGLFGIRMHPNSGKETECMQSRINADQYDFVATVLPTSPVDSYSMLKAADIVLVFTSTIGMEACYNGKAVISLEKSKYNELGGSYNPQSHEEVIQWIMQEELPPLPKDAAIKYGFYTLTFGNKFRFITMKGQNKCSFMGKKVRSPRWIQHLMMIRRKLGS